MEEAVRMSLRARQILSLGRYFLVDAKRQLCPAHVVACLLPYLRNRKLVGHLRHLVSMIGVDYDFIVQATKL